MSAIGITEVDPSELKTRTPPITTLELFKSELSIGEVFHILEDLWDAELTEKLTGDRVYVYSKGAGDTETDAIFESNGSTGCSGVTGFPDGNTIRVGQLIFWKNTYSDESGVAEVSAIVSQDDKEFTADSTIPAGTCTATVIGLGFSEVRDMAAVRDSLRNTTSLGRTKYAGFDFNTIMDESMSYMKRYFGAEFNNFIASDMGIMLIEVFAFIGDTNGFYLSNRADEAFLETCHLLLSAYRHSKQLNYKARGALAAVADISISLANQINAESAWVDLDPFYIAKGTTFIVDGKTWTVAGDISVQGTGSGGLITYEDFDSGVLIVTGEAFEGEILEFSESGTGLKNQEVDLPIESDKYIACNDGYSTLIISGTSWAEKDFIDFSSPQTQFEINPFEDPPKMISGDNVAGEVFPAGDNNMLVGYVQTSGKKGITAVSGSVGATDTKKYKDSDGNVMTDAEIATLNDSIDFTEIKFTSAATGGADPQTVEEIRTYAPAAFATANKAVTDEDFKTIINQFSTSLKGIAQTVRGIVPGGEISQKLVDIGNAIKDIDVSGFESETYLGDNSNAVSTINIQIDELSDFLDGIISESGKANHVSVPVLAINTSQQYVSPSQASINAMKSYLLDKKLITTTISTIDGRRYVVRVNTAISLKILSGYVYGTVQTAVETALRGVIAGKDFGDDLYLIDAYDAIKAVSGVSHASLSFSAVKRTYTDLFGTLSRAEVSDDDTKDYVYGPYGWYNSFKNGFKLFIASGDNAGLYSIVNNGVAQENGFTRIKLDGQLPDSSLISDEASTAAFVDEDTYSIAGSKSVVIGGDDPYIALDAEVASNTGLVNGAYKINVYSISGNTVKFQVEGFPSSASDEMYTISDISASAEIDRLISVQLSARTSSKAAMAVANVSIYFVQNGITDEDQSITITVEDSPIDSNGNVIVKNLEDGFLEIISVGTITTTQES